MRHFLYVILIFFMFFTLSFSAAALEITNSMTMAQINKLTDPDGGLEDFGFSVAISGDTAVIGAHKTNGAYPVERAGAAYIYEFDAASAQFIQVAKLYSSDAVANDQFGYSVAISGDTVVVGANESDCYDYYDGGKEYSCGSAYVFEKQPSGWSSTHENAKLTKFNGQGYAKFGSSVAIDGETIVVGAPRAFGGRGRVNVFTKPSSGGWVSDIEDANLGPSIGSDGYHFGLSVAISGDTIVAGSDRRAAYVFEKTGSAWGDAYENGILTPSDESNPQSHSVAIDGNTVVVGDLEFAYIFERPDSGWADGTENARLSPSDREAGNGGYFGNSVAIDGNTVMIGSVNDNDAANRAGAVYLFKKPGSSWINTHEVSKLLIKDIVSYDNFARSIALSGDTAIMGTGFFGTSDENPSSARDVAYIFKSSIVASTPENQLKALQVTTYTESGATLVHHIHGGDDASKFVLDQWTGLLSFKDTPDFELPSDHNADGIYELDILVDAGESTTVHTLINVTNLAYEGPAIAPEALKELQAIAAPDDNDDNFGEGLAISGNIAVIAAYANNTHGPESGLAYVYEYHQASKRFVKVSTLGDGDSEWEGQFGRSVAIDGDTIVVGAANAEVSQKVRAGAAYVYVKPENGWASEPVYNESYCKITASDEQEYQYFAASVSISGDTIAIGAFGDADMKGAVYIAEKPSVGWTEDIEATIKLGPEEGGYAGAKFGSSVAINGSTVVVGAPNAHFGFNTSGLAYVFEKPLNGWLSTESSVILISSTAADDDHFGESVAIDGNIVIVGAPEKGSKSGSAYSFKKPLSGWENMYESAVLRPALLRTNTYYGNHVAISGQTVVIGAYQSDYADKTNVGSAFVYQLNLETAQSEQSSYISNPNIENGYTYFAKQLAVSGNTVLIATPGDDKGVAYVYNDVPKASINPALMMYLLN